MRFLPIVLVSLLLAGCGGDDDESSVPLTTATTASGSACTPATTDLMTPLANKLTLENGRLVNGQIVKSADHDDLYFVAAEIDSRQLATSGDIGVWATTSPHGAEGIYSVNDLAKQYSDWRFADTIDVSPDDHGVAESRACVFR